MPIFGLMLYVDTSENGKVNEFIREGLQMRAFDHPNVMHLIGICWTLNIAQNLPRTAPLIVFPYMPHGDLKNFLRNCRLQQQEEQVLTAKNETCPIVVNS